MNLNFGKILHGGDYNPEQWPESVWDEDVQFMQRAYVNIATLPVFGWASLEPQEGVHTFGWLDDVIEKLTRGGISLCLATATASQPAWLDQKYPDVLPVQEDGQKRRHSARHSFCPNSENFKRLSGSLARKMAERYGNIPELVLWHISNEYGNRCYCDQCAAAFRVWLRERYGSLDEVNDRWYTRFWGKTYFDWSQIETPTTTGERTIPAQVLDYHRFQSDSFLTCFINEAAILRDITPHIPITTNLMGAYPVLDYHRWAKKMDIVSWDSYPRYDTPPSDNAFAHSLMRGLKDGQPFLLMEQTPSQTNWGIDMPLKPSGEMRLLSYQAIAHGSDAVMYFQWRRSRGGMEKYHGAVVEHAARTDSRVFQEVAQLGKELSRLGGQTLEGRPRNQVALLYDWDTRWAVDVAAGLTDKLDYTAEVNRYFAALHGRGISADIISPESDLAAYKIVVAPMMYMVKPGMAERLEEFVAAGGVLVTTYFSGLVDETDRVHLGGYPGPLRKLAGVWVEETDVVAEKGIPQSVEFGNPFGELSGSVPAEFLCDRIHLESAVALAVYGNRFYAGEPAVTVNKFGEGSVYYLGTRLPKDSLALFLDQVCQLQNVSSVLPRQAEAGLGIEATRRVSPDGRELLYILNHNDRERGGSPDPITVALPDKAAYKDLLTGAIYTDAHAAIPSRGVLILARQDA